MQVLEVRIIAHFFSNFFGPQFHTNIYIFEIILEIIRHHEPEVPNPNFTLLQ